MLDVTTLRAHCAEAGLDIVHPFRLDWFNGDVDASLRLPDGGRPRALALVIGNTHRLWPVFVPALHEDASLLDGDHPLDAYIERALSDAAARSIGASYRIFWAHTMTPAPIAIQRIAHASGLAHLSPSRLSIHPTYGPWLALRAVIVVDVEGPAADRPRAPDPCTPCAKPCVAALERALAATDTTQVGDVERQWKAWANVREVCPEGTALRYGDEQLRYHYTKDRSILRRIAR
jgi:methylmalonic aciduria homocystinuria type C protein